MDTKHVNDPINIDDDNEHVNIIEDDNMEESKRDEYVDLEQTKCDNNQKRDESWTSIVYKPNIG